MKRFEPAVLTGSLVLVCACGQVNAIMPDAQASPDTAADDSQLIDDLEDGDDRIQPVGGRVGSWAVYHDDSPGGVQTPSGTFAPTVGGAGGSKYCAGTTGSGFGVWGAKLSVELDHPPGGDNQPFDLSRLSGIEFQARGNGPVRFEVMTPAALAV